MTDTIANDDPITQEQVNTRWRVRRRLSVGSFLVLATIGVHGAFGKIETSDNIMIAVVYGLVAIVLVYIAGPIVDDWLQSKKK